ncbi:unnamed protein product [Sympodiomycopsis kandeliae]
MSPRSPAVRTRQHSNKSQLPSSSSSSGNSNSSSANDPSAPMFASSKGFYSKVDPGDGSPTSPTGNHQNLLQQSRSIMSDSGSNTSDLGPYAHIRRASMNQTNRQPRQQREMAPAPSPPSGTSSSNYSSVGDPKMLQVLPQDLNRWSYNSALSDTPSPRRNRQSAAVSDDMFLDKGVAEPDDYLHNSDGKEDKAGWHLCSQRGMVNCLALTVVFLGLMALFAGYPVISAFTRSPESNKGQFNLGGTNGTGQVPIMKGLFSLVDQDTPPEAQSWTHPLDNTKHHIVFSDEFNQEGRTFWPGDDPFWEAVDLWYGVTGDKEWYSPESVNTTNGFLQITMEEKITHDLYFQSGMVQSWNKFCFQGGYIEFAAILPGLPTTQGWWPGLWTMGNLGRPGYPGSTDGMWPYSYDSCDTGILHNQTNVDGTGPAEVINAQGPYSGNHGHKLSYLPGMRAPACTCAGEDHPGPNHNVGRASPELDILEAQTANGVGQASQSVQTAPFDVDYAWQNGADYATIYDADATHFNPYTGGIYQEAVSGVTNIPDDAYELSPQPRAVTFGAHYTPDWQGTGDGEVTWFIDGKAAWKVKGSAIGPDSRIDIGQRLIPVEPMAIIMNLGMSDGFQTIRYSSLQFPATLKVDYVRVYQPDGQTDRISCDPPDHPTAQYIEDHKALYYNHNYTHFPTELYGSWPKNRLTGC